MIPVVGELDLLIAMNSTCFAFLCLISGAGLLSSAFAWMNFTAGSSRRSFFFQKFHMLITAYCCSLLGSQRMVSGGKDPAARNLSFDVVKSFQGTTALVLCVYAPDDMTH